MVTSAAALLGLILWIGIAKAGGVGSVNGVLQRVFVAFVLQWIEVMGIRLLLLSRR
ncbi:MAG: hypothetical protein HY675_28815 [Chloroflexi bacterium]|nr:hypothetical protein [Chloroflexota bacterium]